MPSRDVAYVDHTCKLPTQSIVAYFVYYFILVASCGYLAFKTRLLPDSFNESRFITFCVSATMSISAGFIPTYIASERNLMKTGIMLLLVFLNHTMALTFIFLPKIFAVLFVPEIPAMFNCLNAPIAVIQQILLLMPHTTRSHRD
ncbi:hypothetical protein ACOMHN_052668 [Nucella lapillus]